MIKEMLLKGLFRTMQNFFMAIVNIILNVLPFSKKYMRTISLTQMWRMFSFDVILMFPFLIVFIDNLKQVSAYWLCSENKNSFKITLNTPGKGREELS